MPAVDKDRRRFVAALGAASVTALAGCGGGGGGGDTTTETGPGAGVPVEVQEANLDKGTFNTLIDFTLANETSKPIDYVGVEATFLDKDGNELGTGYVETENLGQQAYWTDTIIYEGESDREKIADGDDGFKLEIFMEPPSDSGSGN